MPLSRSYMMSQASLDAYLSERRTNGRTEISIGEFKAASIGDQSVKVLRNMVNIICPLLGRWGQTSYEHVVITLGVSEARFAPGAACARSWFGRPLSNSC